jgi:hypothetical protein
LMTPALLFKCGLSLTAVNSRARKGCFVRYLRRLRAHPLGAARA